VKLVLAVLQPPKLESVRGALERIEVTRLTVCDAQGFGRQRGHTDTYRGHEYKAKLLRKIALEIVVNDDDRLTLRAEIPQQANDRPLRRGIYTLERLIHEVHLRILYERTCEKGALLLPT